MRGSAAGARRALAERLRARRAEIEEAILTRVHAISDPADISDPGYAEGLRTAVSAGLEYGLAGAEAGSERPAPIPPALLGQARLAARAGIGLDTVLRRYFAGHALLGDFTIEEAQRDSLLGDAELKRLWRAQAARFDRLLAAVSEEHDRAAAESRFATSAQRRAELVRRLLDGEPLDATELEYDLDAHHLGLLVAGSGAAEELPGIARELDRRLLLVRLEGEVAWAWLGARRPFEPTELERVLTHPWLERARLAIGEPGEALAGWRLTHRQAAAAMPIAMRGPERAVRYRDVALLAAVLQDDLLATSLRRLYLEPLEEERDGGKALRGTLRAYFAAHGNVSSAAAALGVSRKTVNSRLRAVERHIASPPDDCAMELELALRMRQFKKSDSPANPGPQRQPAGIG